MKHIVLTGGGTAGHVTPNIALIPRLQELGYKISYIGSYEGIEKKLIEELGIPYYGISSGKLRRYFDLKNFSDPFRVLKGFSQARKILKDFQVVHLCGKGKTDESLKGTTGYVQYEYIQDELPDLFAMADVVISRAGANAICEIRELHKPNLLIPLSAKASRGDQILNARSFERQGFSMVLEEEEITETKLLDTIHQLYTDRQKYTEAMAGNGRVDSISKITELIEECARS